MRFFVSDLKLDQELYMHTNNFIIIIDVSPLWEHKYTGISNVVYELTKRFLDKSLNKLNTIFTVFNRKIDILVIHQCINNRSGQMLQEWFSINKDLPIITSDSVNNYNELSTIGLYLHRKPASKVFENEAYLFYDFSFLLATECHTLDTVQYHADSLAQQIDTTDLFFTISESTSCDLQSIFGASKEKIVVTLLGNNVDKKLANKARTLIESRSIEPYFLTIGTIEPRKNINIILAWIEKDKSILDKFRFVFVGREGWGKSFSTLIDEYSLTEAFQCGRIIHYGYVSEAQKAMLLVGAKALFYPSLFEGFGLPVLEAMEIGVPVLASCSTSIPEVLGDVGYYFDPYSLQSFHNAVSEFLKQDLDGTTNNLITAAKIRAGLFSYDKTFSVMYKTLIERFIKKHTACNNVNTENEEKII